MKLKTQSSDIQIDLLPLMDSMFLILVFFVYAMMTMVVHQGLPVDLPKASAALLNQDQYLSISVTKTGTYYLDKSEISLDSLKAMLTSKKETGQLPRVYINADKKAEHAWIVAILDLLRELEIKKVSFETKGAE